MAKRVTSVKDLKTHRVITKYDYGPVIVET